MPRKWETNARNARLHDRQRACVGAFLPVVDIRPAFYIDRRLDPNHGDTMLKYALYAHLKAKPGKAAELEALLRSAVAMAQAEAGTVTWYAFAEDDQTFGIFDT